MKTVIANIRDAVMPILLVGLIVIVGYDHFHPAVVTPPTPVGRVPDAAVVKLGTQFMADFDAGAVASLESVAGSDFKDAGDLLTKFQAAASNNRRAAWKPVADEIKARFGANPTAEQNAAIRQFYSDLVVGAKAKR